MAALDLLGRRFALRVLWELRDGPLTFRTLQARAGGVSPTTLNRRLQELREAGVIELQDGGGFALTSDGKEVCEALVPLCRWANRWGRRLRERRRS